MKTLRKHGWLVAVVSVSVIAAGALVYQGRHSSALADPPEPYEPLTEAQWSAIDVLLADMDLDREALVALNPGSQQIGTVLGTVRSWWEENHGTLDSLQATIDTRVLAVRQLEKATAMGPFQEGRAEALALARQELVTARAAYESALTPLKTSVNRELSDSQRATWVAIQSGLGLGMPIRMLALTDSQRISLSQAHRRYHQQLAGAASQQEQNAAATAWQASLSQILTQDQLTIMEAYDTNYASASGTVAQGFQDVMPVDQG